MLELYTLGTSSAVPTAKRNLFANLIRFGSDRILIDAGEGVQRDLMLEGLGFMQISKVFITHWHADHFSGLLGLIQTMSLEDRQEPLHIYGPRKTHEFVDKLLSIGYFSRTYEIVTHEVNEGEQLSFTTDNGKSSYTITPFRTEHGVPSLGYVFEEESKKKASREKMDELGLKPSPKIGQLLKGKSIDWDGETIEPEDVVEEVPGRKIVITGDTEHSKTTIKYAKDADVLVHDATVAHELVEEGRERHTSAQQAAEIAEEANVKLLVLSHISRRYHPNPQPLLDEARAVFKNTVLAEDGMKFAIKPHRPERPSEIKIE